MKYILATVFLLVSFIAGAQTNKYRFSLETDAVNLLDSSELDSILPRLDGFLAHKNQSVSNNPFVDSAYAKVNIAPFQLFTNIESEGTALNFYKPIVLAVLPIIKHKQYVIKLAYMGVAVHNEPKLRLIYTLVAEKRNDNYYFFDAMDYNVRQWNKKQVGSILYIYPNKLNMAKARQMDCVNKTLAQKFSTRVIPIVYYRCDTPEQLLKMMGFDYIDNMYLSTSGGFAQPWCNKLLSGNNSELYVHELVHFYTNKAFKINSRIVNEGYATCLGGSGGWTLEQLKQFAKAYLNKNPGVDIEKAFTNFDRIQYSIPFTYIVSGLICRDIEKNYGFSGIKKLFDTKDDELYFKTLQSIITISEEQFPAYVKRLIFAQ